MKNLTQLRKNQRPDKTKSGRKQPRTFDLIPINDLYNSEETEQIQLNLDSSYNLLPRSNVDAAIESVISQATIEAPPEHEETNVVDEQEKDEGSNIKLWCICRKVSSGDMIGCDNILSCKIEWYHFSCLNIKRAPDGKWFCPECRSKTSTKRKLEFENESGVV